MRIVVYGEPGAQGSKVFMGRTATGRGIMKETSSKTAPWRADVKTAAEKVLDSLGRPAPFNGAVFARVVFTFNRPASVPYHRRPYPSVYPDLDKLLRSTGDALKAAGVYTDDARIVEYTRAAKVYANEDPEALDRPGALIVLAEAVPLVPIKGSPPIRLGRVA